MIERAWSQKPLQEICTNRLPKRSNLAIQTIQFRRKLLKNSNFAIWTISKFLINCWSSQAKLHLESCNFFQILFFAESLPSWRASADVHSTGFLRSAREGRRCASIARYSQQIGHYLPCPPFACCRSLDCCWTIFGQVGLWAFST